MTADRSCASVRNNVQTVTYSAERTKKKKKNQEKPEETAMWPLNPEPLLILRQRCQDGKKNKRLNDTLLFQHVSNSPVYFMPSSSCLNFFLAMDHSRRESLLSWSTTNKTNLSQFIYFSKKLYMFQTVFPSIIRNSKLHIQRQVSVRPILLRAASLASNW